MIRASQPQKIVNMSKLNNSQVYITYLKKRHLVWSLKNNFLSYVKISVQWFETLTLIKSPSPNEVKSHILSERFVHESSLGKAQPPLGWRCIWHREDAFNQSCSHFLTKLLEIGPHNILFRGIGGCFEQSGKREWRLARNWKISRRVQRHSDHFFLSLYLFRAPLKPLEAFCYIKK